MEEVAYCVKLTLITLMMSCTRLVDSVQVYVLVYDLSCTSGLPYDAMSICLLSSISKCIPLGYAYLIGEEMQLHSPHYFYTKVSRY